MRVAKRKGEEPKYEASWSPRRSVELWLDDIDELFRIVAQVLPNPTAETDEWKELVSAADVAEHHSEARLRSLEIKCAIENRAIGITLGSRTQVQITDRTDISLMGAKEAALDLLSRRHRTLGAWGEMTTFSVLMVLLVVGSFAWASNEADVDISVSPIWVLFAGAVFSSCWTIWGRNWKPTARLVLKRRTQEPSWVRRNRDLLIAIGQILVAVLLFLLSR